LQCQTGPRDTIGDGFSTGDKEEKTANGRRKYKLDQTRQLLVSLFNELVPELQ
jgi:hypothetical protein